MLVDGGRVHEEDDDVPRQSSLTLGCGITSTVRFLRGNANSHYKTNTKRKLRCRVRRVTRGSLAFQILTNIF